MKIHTRIHRFAHPSIITMSLGLLVVAGITIFSLPAEKTNAETLDVSATVNAPPPSSPATITSPTSLQHFNTPRALTLGNCGDGAYVVLFRNNQPSGSAACTGGSFSLQTDLSSGSNLLLAKNYNITNNEGPLASPITVYYDVPSEAPPSPIDPLNQGISSLDEAFRANGLSSSDKPAAAPEKALFILHHPEGYRTYKPGETWKGTLRILEGVAPYALSVNWGDGTVLRHQQGDSQEFIIGHAYQKPGVYHPILFAEDQQGHEAMLQLFIIVKDEDNIEALPQPASPPPLVILATAVVGVVVAAIILTEIALVISSFLPHLPSSGPKD
jgi:hypothetical protein